MLESKAAQTGSYEAPATITVQRLTEGQRLQTAGARTEQVILWAGQSPEEMAIILGQKLQAMTKKTHQLI